MTRNSATKTLLLKKLFEAIAISRSFANVSKLPIVALIKGP